MYEIEKEIELPSVISLRRLYPFKEMEVGDSFFVPLNGRDSRMVSVAIMGAGRATRMKGEKFTTRVNKEKDGVRCWRIE